MLDAGIARGLYDPALRSAYSDEDLAILNSYLQHDRDFNLAYAGYMTYRQSYVAQDRVTKQVFETPQLSYMLIAMTGHINEPREVRMMLVKAFYDFLSGNDLTLPTPIMAGLRTTEKQFSSCVVLSVDDSIPSILAGVNAAVRYVTQKAGLGINVKNRGLGAPVRNGVAKHTGMIGFLRLFESAINCCSQGGVRKGSATINLPIWHYEIETVLKLRSNLTLEKDAVRGVDYALHFNSYLIQRMLDNKPIALFRPNEAEVPGLYNAYYLPTETEFIRLYEKYEADPTIARNTVSGKELLYSFIKERSESRYYSLHTTNTNRHTPYTDPILQTNLCTEIAIPTEHLGLKTTGTGLLEETGVINLCTLASINLGKIKTPEQLRPVIRALVRFLDNLLDYQQYPIAAAELGTKHYRPLGIGVINYAYWLAKQGYDYSSDSGLQATHELFEALGYYALEASSDLAAERGACPASATLKNVRDGQLCVDTYAKALDSVAAFPYKQDWSALRVKVQGQGVRNSSQLAQAPTETSAFIANATNGIEPPLHLFSVKKGLPFLVPEVNRLAHRYELAWDMHGNTGFARKVAVMQKFMDQAISYNTYFNPNQFPDGKVRASVVIQDWLTATELGIKTHYYQNTLDHSGKAPEDDGCGSGACKI